MLDPRRRAYLAAMGIDLWSARAPGVVDSLVAESELELTEAVSAVEAEPAASPATSSVAKLNYPITRS